MSPSEMDALLEVCLLQALRTTAKDKVLPLTQGQFWNAHILLARPPDTKLDVRYGAHVCKHCGERASPLGSCQSCRDSTCPA